MSARQNKRKARANPFHRERTVTTLTEDPTTHLLVPTPTEEPAKYTHPRPHSYPQQQHDPISYPQDSYQFDYPLELYSDEHNYPLEPSMPAQTQFYVPQAPASDLEVLQNLKEMIKAGQHEFYRAVPQPQALAAIYLGPNAQVGFFHRFRWQIPPFHPTFFGGFSVFSKPRRA
ncbi:hypothetical protein C8R44DRAFT_640269 [Mycena epipterygia]|nr:hypothetical protein C8R44DRAFT_640269 [Mycena epipterygia]